MPASCSNGSGMATGEFSGDVAQLAIDRLPSAAGLGEICSHHLVERRGFAGIVELQSRRELARQQSIVGFAPSLMLDDDHFRADNGYNAMRLDIGQQLIPKTVVIRHHAPVSYATSVGCHAGIRV